MSGACENAYNAPAASSGELNEDERSPRDIVREVVDACDRVYQYLGPGLTEILYQNAIVEECSLLGLLCDKEVQIPLRYHTGKLLGHIRADLVVSSMREDCSVIVEIKTVSGDITGNTAGCKQYRHQVRRYANLLGVEYGVLVNFPSDDDTNGIQTYTLDQELSLQTGVRSRKRRAASQ
jgi:GxxExxY protein